MVLTDRRLFSDHIAGVFVLTHTEQPRVPKLVVIRPLNEADLHDDLGLDPMGAQAREADCFSKRRLFDCDLIELASQVEQKVCIKAGADLAGEDEIIAVVITNQQSAQADSFALGIGEAADYEFLGQLAFHLQPVA